MTPINIFKPVLLDRDRLGMVDRNAVAACAVSIYDALSKYPFKETQLVALAAAFMLMCRAWRIKPQDVFETANNVIYDPLHADGIKAQFAGITSYLETEGFVG